MRIELKDQVTRSGVISWHRSVRSPLVVPTFEGPHYDLVARADDVLEYVEGRQLGRAYLIRRWLGKTVYWTRRRADWSADARRVDQRLTLVGFARMPCSLTIPGYPTK